MRFHQVQIQILDNEAVLMVVGCKTIGFSSIDVALENLAAYYKDPKGVEQKFAERYGWPLGDRLSEPVRSFDESRPMPAMGAIGVSGGLGGMAGGIR